MDTRPSEGSLLQIYCVNVSLLPGVRLTITFIYLFSTVQITLAEPATWDTRPSCAPWPALLVIGMTSYGTHIRGNQVLFSDEEGSIQVDYTFGSDVLRSHLLSNPWFTGLLVFYPPIWPSDKLYVTSLIVRVLHPGPGVSACLIPQKYFKIYTICN